MAPFKELYENTSFRYREGLELIKIKDKMVHPDYIERINYNGDVAPSDMYLLRGVLVFRVATARMVAEWLIYYRNRYGNEACDSLPLLKPQSDILENDTGIPPDYVKSIEERLKKLAKKSVLFHMKYGFPEPQNLSPAERKEINFFVANTYTYHIVRARFDTDTGYVGNYFSHPAHKMLSTMHACSMTMRAFLRCKDAEIFREKSVIYGSAKEYYTPDIMVERELGGLHWYIMGEGFHFQFCAAETSAKELGEAYRLRITHMKDLLRHETYVCQKYERAEKRYRFLVCTDSWRGLAIFLKMLEPSIDIFSGRVFVTSDAVLQTNHYDLSKSCRMVFAKEEENGAKTAALRLPKLEDLKSNPWILS